MMRVGVNGTYLRTWSIRLLLAIYNQLYLFILYHYYPTSIPQLDIDNNIQAYEYTLYYNIPVRSEPGYSWKVIKSQSESFVNNLAKIVI